MPYNNDTELVLDIIGTNVRNRKRALQIVYEKGFAQVRNFILSQGGTLERAEDVFQEGVMILYQNLKAEKFQFKSSLYTYLTNICRYQYYKVVRKEKEVPKLYVENSEMSEEKLDAEFNPELVNETLSELKGDCRNILKAFYYEKKSMAEIAKMFNLSNDQVARNKKSRCMKSLMELIKRKKLTLDSFMK